MKDVVPASATEVFKNERRELSKGIMVKTACLVAGTVGTSGASGSEIVTPSRRNQSIKKELR